MIRQFQSNWIIWQGRLRAIESMGCKEVPDPTPQPLTQIHLHHLKRFFMISSVRDFSSLTLISPSILHWADNERRQRHHYIVYCLGWSIYLPLEVYIFLSAAQHWTRFQLHFKCILPMEIQGPEAFCTVLGASLQARCGAEIGLFSPSIVYPWWIYKWGFFVV